MIAARGTKIIAEKIPGGAIIGAALKERPLGAPSATKRRNAADGALVLILSQATS